MNDTPVWILAGTIWSYWIGVGVMVGRTYRRGRIAAGLVPQTRFERMLWAVWIPLIVLWNVLPLVPVVSFLESGLARGLRWTAALLGVACLFFTLVCWVQMGQDWSIGVVPGRTGRLITAGPFRRVRHPIYAASILLVWCTVAVMPSVLSAVLAAAHTTLMFLKARSEEAFLSRVHGTQYAAYCRVTGRFLPRLSGARENPSETTVSGR